MTMLRQDAETNGAPGHVVTLTSRDPDLTDSAFREATTVFWRAFRRRFGSVEYCGFIEWTTGAGPRSGGRRRLHAHYLVKGLKTRDLGAVESWVRGEWAKLTGAWIVQVAALESAGGVVGYLALHHEKMEQAPPAGWRGRRLRPSKGYFAEDGRTRRDRARHWLQARRDSEDGELQAPTAAPRLVWRTPEAQKAAAEIVRQPGRPFDSLPERLALEARLCDPAAPIHQPIGDEDVQRWRAFDSRRRALAARDAFRRATDNERELLRELTRLAGAPAVRGGGGSVLVTDTQLLDRVCERSGHQNESFDACSGLASAGLISARGQEHDGQLSIGDGDLESKVIQLLPTERHRGPPFGRS